VLGDCIDDWYPFPCIVASALRKSLKAALFATKRCVINAPPLAGIEMSPLVNEWDAVTKNPAAPTAGFWFQVISAPPLIAAEVVIAETARSRPERSCNARQLHIDFVGAMLVKQHWGAGWQIRRRGTISAVRLELWRANFRRFVVDYRRQYAVRVCAARDRDVAGHDLGHKSPFTTRINADGEAALGIPHSPSVPKDEGADHSTG
jgi:hypothetical protein